MHRRKLPIGARCTHGMNALWKGAGKQKDEAVTKPEDVKADQKMNRKKMKGRLENQLALQETMTGNT